MQSKINSGIESGIGFVWFNEGTSIDSQNFGELRTVALDLLSNNDCSSLVFDSSGIVNIDSLGLGVIVNARKRCDAARKPFVIDDFKNNTDVMHEIMQLTGLDKSIHYIAPNNI